MRRLTPSQPEAGSVGRQWQRHEAEWASEGVEGRLRSLRAEYLLSLRESPSLVLAQFCCRSSHPGCILTHWIVACIGFGQSDSTQPRTLGVCTQLICIWAYGSFESTHFLFPRDLTRGGSYGGSGAGSDSCGEAAAGGCAGRGGRERKAGSRGADAEGFACDHSGLCCTRTM